jgi:hypothetical protein
VRATLFRELGNGAREEDRRAVYAAGLRAQTVFESEPGRKITAFAADHTDGKTAAVIGTSAGDVRCGATYYYRGILGWGLMKCLHRAMPIEQDEQTETLSVHQAAVTPLVHSHSAVTSISVSSSRCLLSIPHLLLPRRRR